MSDRATTLIKVGGSLLNLPDLAARLRSVMACYGRVLLFPGGGATADVIRDLDRNHALGEELAHWLALRALSVNAHFLQALLPELRLAVSPEIGVTAILEPYAFALADEENPDHLPHCWEVTSDSLAARAALLWGAQELVLLKSRSLEHDVSWAAAAAEGLVDRYFPRIIEKCPELRVRVVNLRAPNARSGA